jgi:hypothetical protein
MYQYLKDRALKEIWCTPDQDREVIIEPARLTVDGGSRKDFTILWRSESLPDIDGYWHVYQIGQLYPTAIGLLPKSDIWVSLSDACNKNKLICDVYVKSGLQIPRFDTFYKYTSDRDLIVAVRVNPKLNIDFDAEKVFFRFYTNAYFESVRSNASIDSVFVAGGVPATVNDILTLQITYNTYTLKPGLVYCFVNGYKVSSINLFTVVIKDIVEIVYDSSIKCVHRFVLENLPVFQSTLDNKLKYLLNYNWLTNAIGVNPETIDYRDDIDVFIEEPIDGSSTRFRGVFYHKNLNDAFRQVTHRDYSVPTTYVTGYLDTLIAGAGNRIINAKKLSILLHVRKSGYERPLVLENNRIEELYKLDTGFYSGINQVSAAMTGIDSTVDNWKAATLESAQYPAVMDAKCCDVTLDMVQEAYGYNAITKMIGDTPMKPELFSGQLIVSVPYALQYGSTAFEYDSNGYLLGWTRHTLGSVYRCVNSNTALVEMIAGAGTHDLGDVLYTDNAPIDPSNSYRIYYSLSGGNVNDWVDITDTDQYIVNGNLVRRTVNVTIGKILVRKEKRFLCYDLSLPMTNGNLRFIISQLTNVNGNYVPSELHIPLGELDIFLNGKSLIKDLDYVLNFPEIVITNKIALVNPTDTNQLLTIRFTGYANSKLEIGSVIDTGFIEHGILSNNNRYDIRDDKVLRIVINNALVSKENLKFSETTGGVSPLNPINGQPYSIREIPVPLLGLTNDRTGKLRNESVVIDKAISAYMTLKLPQPVRSAPSAIANRYPIFSPFVCAVIYALVNNQIDLNNFPVIYSDNEVMAKCKPFEELLKFDPTQLATEINHNYVIVHPHNLTTVINVTLLKYRFIESVVRIYTNNQVVLSSFLSLSSI